MEENSIPRATEEETTKFAADVACIKTKKELLKYLADIRSGLYPGNPIILAALAIVCYYSDTEVIEVFHTIVKDSKPK